MFELLAVTRAIDRLLAAIARASGWLFIGTAAVICFDVITRKIGYQLPYFSSTKLQELEWHLAALLFLGWIGYGVVRDTHVRIDVFTAGLSQRTKDRIDLLGGLVFAIPYCVVVLPYAVDFFQVSLGQLESSDAPNGLPARYVIKGFLAVGIVLLLLAAISFTLRRVVDVFGPPELHRRRQLATGVEL
jgi:TRAP-type mannitol/chloroaromatic compound transport system permease small subunit